MAERLINGLFCISCYNRHREALINRNARGKIPMLASTLHPEALVVITDDGTTEQIVRAEKVLTSAELIMITARSGAGPALFGWARHHA